MKRLILPVAIAAFALLAMGLGTSLAKIRTHTVTCGTTATAITDGTGASSMLIWNNSATPVYLGGSDVNTTTEGFPICTDTANCLRADMPIDAKYLYCRVSAGTVTVRVLAGAL
ncbi:MAG: hypothetical protein IT459_23810 [Planctomycetes bacterium]|nr:hypothetical protein [Planctomycetota bacterium]